MKTLISCTATFIMGVAVSNLFVLTSEDNATLSSAIKSKEGVTITKEYVNALEGVAISANNLLETYEMGMPQTILMENINSMEYKDLQHYNSIVDSIWCEEIGYEFGD